MKEPLFLYHYTTLNTLELILKNHTIRFKPLDTVDDTQEEEYADLKRAGQFVYVSSWTNQEKEIIPMWERYAPLENGVRIRLPFEPFEIYNLTVGDAARLAGKSGTILNADQVFRKSAIPVDKIIAGEYFSPEMIYDIIYDDKPIQVQYTDKQEELFPQVLIREDGEVIGIELGLIGKYKNGYWAYQKEWRHKITVFPGSAEAVIKGEPFKRTWKEICSGERGRPLEFYDRKIKDDAYHSMVVRTSPKFGLQNERVIRELADKYNHNMKIEKSELKGRIR